MRRSFLLLAHGRSDICDLMGKPNWWEVVADLDWRLRLGFGWPIEIYYLSGASILGVGGIGLVLGLV